MASKVCSRCDLRLSQGRDADGLGARPLTSPLERWFGDGAANRANGVPARKVQCLPALVIACRVRLQTLAGDFVQLGRPTGRRSSFHHLVRVEHGQGALISYRDERLRHSDVCN